MLSFTFAVFFLLITPGPGVLSTAGVGASFGFRSGLRFLVGLFIGTNLVALGVLTGVAAVVLSVPWLRNVLGLLSALYLLYLAVRIALTGSRIAFITAREPLGLLNGIALQAINPKAYAVNTALFGGFAFWPGSLAAETAVKLLVINLIWIPIHLLWLASGVWLHRLQLSPRTQFIVNLGMAGSLLLVVGLAVWAAMPRG